VSEKVALVTGASRGIGRAVAEALLARGRRVLACARDERALAEFAAQHPGRVEILPIDLALQSAPEKLADEALRLTGHVDELVYAAGIVRYAPVGEVSAHDLQAQLTVNVIAPFLLGQTLGRAMHVRGSGAQVYVSSTLAFRSAALTSAYAASKAALISMTHSFALELAPHVRVNAIAPGVIDTDMIRVPRDARTRSADERERAIDETLSGLASLHPLGRIGNVADVAQAALYLLDASWVTGSVLTVDGGLAVR
jgi:NAD(P)-dependent dehydrogenase (short-subunit alcohol dehydrogenase family)